MNSGSMKIGLNENRTLIGPTTIRAVSTSAFITMLVARHTCNSDFRIRTEQNVDCLTFGFIVLKTLNVDNGISRSSSAEFQATSARLEIGRCAVPCYLNAGELAHCGSCTLQ